LEIKFPGTLLVLEQITELGHFIQGKQESQETTLLLLPAVRVALSGQDLGVDGQPQQV
jgi:hypothetical protein